MGGVGRRRVWEKWEGWEGGGFGRNGRGGKEEVGGNGEGPPISTSPLILSSLPTLPSPSLPTLPSPSLPILPPPPYLPPSTPPPPLFILSTVQSQLPNIHWYAMVAQQQQKTYSDAASHLIDITADVMSGVVVNTASISNTQCMYAHVWVVLCKLMSVY